MNPLTDNTPSPLTSREKPLMSESIKAYLQQLNDLGQQTPLRPDAQNQAAAKAWRDSHRPLTDRLRDLLETVPEEARYGGIQLRWAQERLAGRTGKKKCSHTELGDAFRQLGYYRERQWRPEEEGFRALWKLKRRQPHL